MNSAPLADIVAEAERILAAAEGQGVVLRLIGGLAVHMRAHPMPAALARSYGDIDTATVKGQNRPVTDLLTGLGYEAAQQFNALHGASRMLFHDRPNDRKLDVFVDGFELNHAIPITARIDAEQRTIPLAELLLTKLQVVEFTDKDMRDTLALLVRHDVGPSDGETINGDVVAALTAEDWGLWRTTELNLERLREGLGTVGLDEPEQQLVLARIDALWERIEAEPKSKRWRMRARVGDRKRWYQVPDEV
ncbi:MAG TPA: hypothetical protein VGF74_05835 [Thermoleophilaceae bacterium]|jgi:hypothetical protein